MRILDCGLRIYWKEIFTILNLRIGISEWGNAAIDKLRRVKVGSERKLELGNFYTFGFIFELYKNDGATCRVVAEGEA